MLFEVELLSFVAIHRSVYERRNDGYRGFAINKASRKLASVVQSLLMNFETLQLNK